MPRPAVRLFFVGLIGTATVLAGGWWWWTAPPAASPNALAAVAAWAPADAEGVIAVAQAPRLARWLARHRAAAGLALLAAPTAGAAVTPLAPIAPSVARTAVGPVVAWWGISQAGLSARVRATDTAGLRQVAALGGLGWYQKDLGNGEVQVWVLHGEPFLKVLASPPPLLPGDGPWSALIQAHRRWWYVRVTRTALVAQYGAPPPVPHCESETIVVSARLPSLLAPGTWFADERVALLATAEGDWAVRVGDHEPSASARRLTRLLGVQREAARNDETEGVWKSPFGTLFLGEGPNLAIASQANLLLRLPTPTATTEWGCVAGGPAAAALERTASALPRVPGLPTREQLASLAGSLRQVRACAWRVEAEGGQLVVRW